MNGPRAANGSPAYASTAGTASKVGPSKVGGGGWMRDRFVAVLTSMRSALACCVTGVNRCLRRLRGRGRMSGSDCGQASRAF